MDLLQVAAAAAAEPFVPEPLLLMLPLVQLQGPPVLPVGQGSAGTAASASAAAERRCFANGLLLLRDRLLLWKGCRNWLMCWN